MYLVDTSCWIELLRAKGRTDVKQRLSTLLEEGEAAWCHVVRLELWNSASAEYDLKSLNELEAEVPSLQIDERVWSDAIRLSKLARSNGVTIPNSDLVIAACARVHKVEIESIDNHFKELATLR